MEQESVGEGWNDEAHIVWIVHYKTASSVSTSPYLLNLAGSKINSASVSGTEPAVTVVKNKFPIKSTKRGAERIKHKITARFEIHKDITQAVLPVSKVRFDVFYRCNFSPSGVQRLRGFNLESRDFFYCHCLCLLPNDTCLTLV